MGTGKTTVGQLLAKKLGLRFVDLDDVIEKNAGKRIPEIFEDKGEQHFRSLEKQAVDQVCRFQNQVISCGGGVVLFDENINRLKKSTIIICLTATADTIFARIKTDTSRPLLATQDPYGKIKELLEFRKPFYEKADVQIATDNLTQEKVVEKILTYLKTAKQKK
ncbi:Shikimate kinase [Candidatus Gugararchaeum adminiculabundum]|nr:Shikimate kinase [Candidatus Gugararchaeum adminiculabundum]